MCNNHIHSNSLLVNPRNILDSRILGFPLIVGPMISDCFCFPVESPSFGNGFW